MLFYKKTLGTLAYLGGVPAVSPEFASAWGEMALHAGQNLCQPGETVHLDMEPHSYHTYARNALAERMRGEWLLQFDCDHVPEPDVPKRLVHFLTRHDLDVLTGLYCFKSSGHPPVLYFWNGAGYLPVGAWGPTDLDPEVDVCQDVFQVEAAGAGVLLVRRRVFERIEQELSERPFDIRAAYRNPEMTLSEDLSFFDRCSQLGIVCWCAPEVESPHQVRRTVSLADFDRSLVSAETRVVRAVGERKRA